MSFCQRVLSKDSNLLSKTCSGMQSGGEEEQDEEAHTPLPPRMEIIKDPSAQDDKVEVRAGSVRDKVSASSHVNYYFVSVYTHMAVSVGILACYSNQ